MKLKVISSCSEGNCYLLESSEGSTLILEAGVRFSEIKQALGYNLSKVVGCLVTHRHNDHAKSVVYMLRAGINVYSSEDVFLAKHSVDNNFACVLNEMRKEPLQGDFLVTALKAYHDIPCYAYIIEHPEMGKLLFATDTFKLPYYVRGLNHLMIECNYQDDILQWNEEQGRYPLTLRDRLMLTHMELKTTKMVVKKNLSERLQDIVLVHLSNDNSNFEHMQKDISSVSGLPVYVAKAGLTINLDYDPY